MSMVHLKELLVAKGKTQSELAQALGRDKSAITNLLQGKRQLKAKEVPIIAGFLEVSEAQVLGLETPAEAGFAESLMLPFHGAPSAEALASGAVKEQNGGFVVEITSAPQQSYALEVKDRSLDLEGLMPGDLVICDPARSPAKGDVVVVQCYAEDGTAQSVLRLYHTPFLRVHSSEAGHTQLHEERANVAVLAPVIRLIRAY